MDERSWISLDPAHIDSLPPEKKAKVMARLKSYLIGQGYVFGDDGIPKEPEADPNAIRIKFTLRVDGLGTLRQDVAEYDRAEWEAMSNERRAKELREWAAEHVIESGYPEDSVGRRT